MSRIAAMPLTLQLRERTAAAHRALESRLAILRPSLTFSEYLEILRAFYGFLAPWWPQVARCLPLAVAETIDGARHVQRLTTDLQAFGEVAENLTLASAMQLPKIDSAAAALGSCYVVEGSMLGARVIAPELQRRFNIGPAHGAMYFGGDGEQTGKRWALLRAMLDDLVDEGEQHAAIMAAEATFSTLLQWFEMNGVTR